jgi:hypothetical protein
MTICWLEGKGGLQILLGMRLQPESGRCAGLWPLHKAEQEQAPWSILSSNLVLPSFQQK